MKNDQGEWLAPGKKRAFLTGLPAICILLCPLIGCEPSVESVNRTTDQSKLAEIASEAHHYDIRQAALTKLTNQLFLAKIATTASNSDACHSAVAKLTDETLLAQIAIGLNDLEIRQTAVTKLADQSKLVEVAIKASTFDIRQAAVAKLTDQASLTQVATEADNFNVRQAALDKLTNQALKQKMAVDSKEQYYRGLTFDQLTNQLGAHAISLDDLTDQTLLAQIAVETEDRDFRQDVFAKLTNQVLLAQIINCSSSFVLDEFKRPFTPHDLLEAIIADGIEVPAAQSELERLNKLLTGTSLQRKFPDNPFTPMPENLCKADSKFTSEEREQYNRLILEAAYPSKCPRSEIAHKPGLDVEVELAAFHNLTKRSPITGFIADSRVPLEVKHFAIAKLDEGNADYQKLAGDLNVRTHDLVEAYGRIHLALTNPIVTNRFPDLTLDVRLKEAGQNYNLRPVSGELITFNLKRGSEVLASKQWTTAFPVSFEFDLNRQEAYFLAAEVHASGFLAKLFRAASFSKENLVALSKSNVPEIRAAAEAIIQGRTDLDN